MIRAKTNLINGGIKAAILALLATGSVTLAHAEDGASQVEHCSRALGTIAVSEPQGPGYSQLSSYGLGSPVAVLRMMIQQSGCFTVVERGAALNNIQQERALQQNGELQGGSNMGKGQMQAADFVMTPSVQFAQNSGGVGGALSRWGGGGILGVVGGIAGGLKFKEAQTSLTIADVRSSIQVAAAEGTAKKTDFSVSGWSWGGASYGNLGGYTDTPEGKVVAASLLDNYNKIVLAIRDQPNLVRNANSATVANTGTAAQTGAPINAGDLLRPRINNVRIFAEPKASSKVVATLNKGDEMVASGEDRDGFVKVDASSVNGGWVQKTLVTNH